jgi:hypothetical protein
MLKKVYRQNFPFYATVSPIVPYTLITFCLIVTKENWSKMNIVHSMGPVYGTGCQKCTEQAVWPEWLLTNILHLKQECHCWRL